MKLKDFKECIDKTEKLQRARYEQYGLCYSIYCGFSDSYEVKEKFGDIFEPCGTGVDGRDRRGYFLGDKTKKNLERRIDTLRFFEQICITDKLYKEF